MFFQTCAACPAKSFGVLFKPTGTWPLINSKSLTPSASRALSYRPSGAGEWSEFIDVSFIGSHPKHTEVEIGDRGIQGCG